MIKTRTCCCTWYYRDWLKCSLFDCPANHIYSFRFSKAHIYSFETDTIYCRHNLLVICHAIKIFYTSTSFDHYYVQKKLEMKPVGNLVRQFVAEILGTFVFLLIALGSVAQVVIAGGKSSIIIIIFSPLYIS